ncbi:hypothetical protein FBQ82_00780 [Anaerolineae bacterium CFX7]|nr:hypothetical protein [Anaerolineae bacterium CFX7]
MMWYAPNVLVAFMGALGIFILVLVLQIKPQHQLIQGARTRIPFLKRLQRKLNEAELDISATEFLRVALFSGLALGLILFLSIGAWTGFLVGLGVGFAGYWSYLEDRRDKRRRKYQEEIAAVIDMLLQATAASMSMDMAIDFVAERAPGAVRADFIKVRDLRALGTPTVEAMQLVAAERRDMIFDRLIEALTATITQNSKLYDVLVPMNEMVRGLTSARRRIATAQVRIRWEARIVCIAPFIFILILNQTAPDLQRPFYASIVGQIALIVIGILCFSAYYLMNRLGARALRPMEYMDAPNVQLDAKQNPLGALA